MNSVIDLIWPARYSTNSRIVITQIIAQTPFRIGYYDFAATAGADATDQMDWYYNLLSGIDDQL